MHVRTELTELAFVESSVDSEDHYHFSSLHLLHLTLVVAQVLLTHTLEGEHVGLAVISWRLCVVNSHFAPIERESLLQRLSLHELENSQASTLTNGDSLHKYERKCSTKTLKYK